MTTWRRHTTVAVSLIMAWAGSVSAANLLTNGDFEDGYQPWLRGFGPPMEELYVTGEEAASGKGCIRFLCDGRNAAVDHPELRFGDTLNRLGTYRLSAMIRNDGVEHGNFGLRLYFRDANDQMLSMGGGIALTSGSATHGWKRLTTTFGRGTPTRIPPGAARLVVRFSFWSEDGESRGDVWLDDVALEQTGTAVRPADHPPTAILWQDEDVEPTTGAGAHGLQACLEDAGFTVTTLTTEALRVKGALDIAEVDVVVLPYGPWYPAALTPALVTYAGEGGAVVTLGSRPLTQPLYHTGAGWEAQAAAAAGTSAIPLDGTVWDIGHAGPDDDLSAVPLEDGPGILATIADLQGYAYVGTELPDMPADDMLVTFDAKGDALTPRLCLELTETDTSRWKAMIPLTPEWQTVRIHMGEFISYANEKVGRSGTIIRPRNVETLMLGFTAAMVGKGRHTFQVRNLRLEPAAVSTEAVALMPRFISRERDAAKWFGKYAEPGPHLALPDAVSGGTAWEAGALKAADHALLTVSGKARGDFSGVSIPAADEVESDPMASRASLVEGIRKGRTLDRIPLLQTAAFFGPDHTVAALLFNRAGALAGSRWIHVGVDDLDLRDHPVLGAALANGLSLACDGLYVDSLRPRFRAAGNSVVMDIAMMARNLSARPFSSNVTATLTSEGKTVTTRATAVNLQGLAGAVDSIILAEGIPVESFAWQDFVIEASMDEDAPPMLGQTSFAFNALESLRAVCDIMVQEGADDGTFLGTSFVDNRGARALLGAYEIFGTRAYRRAAFDWGQVMLDEQRDDGGYRMGYGITSKGESCYVADGGEIAVAIARLVSYARGDRRETYLESLDDYMEYREFFRVPSGGIGVGWCMQDYGQRPIVPLDKPTKIFAPEKNTYTIGCTLAAAYAHAALHGDRELFGQAARDADWLMARADRLNGAYIESYVYAHAFTPHEERRQQYAEYIERTFSEPMRQAAAREASWWLHSEGRSALNLGGLAYVLDRIGPDPALQAEMMRASCLMFSPDSPESVFAALQRDRVRAGKWIYTCFGSLGFVDVIRPVVSMEEFVPDQR